MGYLVTVLDQVNNDQRTRTGEEDLLRHGSGRIFSMKVLGLTMILEWPAVESLGNARPAFAVPKRSLVTLQEILNVLGAFHTLFHSTLSKNH